MKDHPSIHSRVDYCLLDIAMHRQYVPMDEAGTIGELTCCSLTHSTLEIERIGLTNVALVKEQLLNSARADCNLGTNLMAAILTQSVTSHL